jgi:hypothetical protein
LTDSPLNIGDRLCFLDFSPPFVFLLGVFALSWSAAEESPRVSETLKQKFLKLEGSLPSSGKPKGALKRGALKVGGWGI